MKKIFLLAVAACLALSLHGVAGANVIFFDNFDSENGGVAALNYNNFTHWSVTGGGTVDLIGNGAWDFLPGNGLYVDLDGSTQNPGLFSTAFTLTPGLYELSFRLAGSQNGTHERVTVQVGDPMFFEIFDLAPTDPFTEIVRDFYVPQTETNVTLSFLNDNDRDNIGALLDNVSLASIPEPASLSLLGFGLLGLLGLKRKK